MRRKGLVWTIRPGAGRSASIRIVPAGTDAGPKRSRNTAR